MKPVEDALKALAKPYEEKLTEEAKKKLEPSLLEALNTPADKRTPEQKILAQNAKDQIEATWDEVVAAMTPEDKEKRTKLREQLHQIEMTEPDPLQATYAFVNTGEPAPQSYVLRMGDPKNQLDPVDPRCRPSSRRVTKFRKNANRPADRPGNVDQFARKSADRASDGEPHLAVSDGLRPCPDTKRLGPHGRQACSETVHQLAGLGVCGEGLERESHRSLDRSVERVPSSPLPRTRRKQLSTPTTVISGE